MDYICESIKIYVCRKWIKDVQHKFICTEFNNNNVKYYKSELILDYFSINCQTIASTQKNAKSKALLLLFDELKLKSLLTENIVLGNIGFEKESSFERNVRLISERLFNEGPSFMSMKCKTSELYKVTMGKVIFEIKAVVSETFRIIFYLINNAIKDMFNLTNHHHISKSSIVGIYMAPEVCTLKEVNTYDNKRTNNPKNENNNDNINKKKNEENVEFPIPLDENCGYMQFFKDKGFSQSARIYLGKIVEKSVQCSDTLKDVPVMSSPSQNQEWKIKLSEFVSTLLTELLITTEISAEDYRALLNKIVDKILLSGVRKLDNVRMREFIAVYVESYKNRNQPNLI